LANCEASERTRSAKEAVWEIVRDSTWDRCFVRCGEVRIVWQRFNAAYDYEPEIDCVVSEPAHFLGGEYRELVTSVFGELVYREMLAETRARNEGIAAITPPSNRPVVRPAETKTDSDLWSRAASLIGFLCLIAFSAWVLYWPARRCASWYRAHFQEVLLTAEGTITNRSMQRFEGYVRNTRIYGFEGFVAVRYEASGDVHAVKISAGRYPGSEKAFAEKFPIGATRTIYYFASDVKSPRLFEGDLRPGIIWLLVDLCLVAFGAVMVVLCMGWVNWRRG
jgi:hypothetical protein